MLTSRGLGRVLGDLAALGYDAEWCVLGACDVGAPHKRERIWILAHAMPAGERGQQREGKNERDAVADAAQLLCNGSDDNAGVGACGQSLSESGNGGGAQDVADSASERQPRQGQPWYAFDPAEDCDRETDRTWAERVGHVWGIESRLGRVANGVADRMVRLKAIGNGQVPSVAALAFQILSARLE